MLSKHPKKAQTCGEGPGNAVNRPYKATRNQSPAREILQVNITPRPDPTQKTPKQHKQLDRNCIGWYTKHVGPPTKLSNNTTRASGALTKMLSLDPKGRLQSNKATFNALKFYIINHDKNESTKKIKYKFAPSAT